MAFIWDNANSSEATHIITNNGLTARSSQVYNTIVRTNDPIPSGKYYWEVTGASLDGYGARAGVSRLTDADWINDPSAFFIAEFSSTQHRFYDPNGDSVRSPKLNANDVVGLAFDTANGLLWIAINNTWINSGNPAGGTNALANNFPAGDYYPSLAFGGFDQADRIFSANFGASPTAYAPPVGFTTLDSTPPSELVLNLGYALQTVQPIEQAVNLSYSQVSIQPHEQVVNLAYQVEADAVWTPVVTAIHYTLKLVADGFSDLILPMSSFQSRLRQSTPSYLQVIVPAALDYVDEINDRSAGDIVIERGLRWTDGTIQTTEIARVNFETLRIDQGATNDSATLTGHKTTTNSTPKAVNLQGVQTRSLSGSSIRYRCEIDNSLRPGDTANINNESFIVSAITYVVSPVEAYMEIANGG